MRANELAECVNLTEIMDFKQEIRDFSYGTSSGEKIYDNISVNSMRSEGERDLVFHSEFRVSNFDV